MNGRFPDQRGLRSWLALTLASAILGTAPSAHAITDLSQYDLYPGDFDGDGVTDVLYIAQDQSRLNGIALSDGAGFSHTLQTWTNTFLGIPWNEHLYKVIVADYDGDGRDDVFLQRRTPGDHYLLLTREEGLVGIAQAIPETHAGLDWSAGEHTIVAGDFDGSGTADLFLQAARANGLNAVLLSNEEGLFTSKRPAQSWAEGFAGFRWNQLEAFVFAGDFNGDARSELLVQARPFKREGDERWQFVANGNGVLLAGRPEAKTPFSAQDLQAWNRDGFAADWAPYSSNVIVGDFDGDASADVVLQGVEPYNASYLLRGRAQGPIFESAIVLDAAQVPPASERELVAGHFSGEASAQLLSYVKDSRVAQGFIRISKTGIAASSINSSLGEVISSAANLFSSPPPSLVGEGGGVAPMALVTPNTAGRTPGQFAVSAMGAATYQIPIWTPPGARELEPKLALVYTSGGADGPLGPGWSLGGLSVLARCNKTYAANAGQPAAVTLTTADDLCLDGNRLRLTSGTQGVAGSVYQTEIATFDRVTAYQSAGNGPSYFIVEGKDGLKYEYGNSTDSKAHTVAGSTPYAWLLSKIVDRQGNNLKITYSTTSGDIQPLKIEYTQVPSKSSTYPYTVEFTYKNRVTNLSRYVAGGKIEQAKVLSKINVKSGSTSVRQYNLEYEATTLTTLRDRLVSIQECAGSSGTDCLRPTLVGYQNGAVGVANPSTSVATSTTGKVTSADVNGDGLIDLLYSTGTEAAAQWFVRFANSDGSYATAVTTGLTSASNTNTLFGDVYGEGRTAVVAPVSGVWRVTRWTGSAFTTQATTTAYEVGSSNALADTDGDGQPDLVSYKNDGNIYIFRNLSSAYSPQFAAPSTAFSWGYTPSLNDGSIHSDFDNGPYGGFAGPKMLDFDGDGRQDIVAKAYTYTYDLELGLLEGTQYVLLVSRGSTFSVAPSNYLPYYYPVYGAGNFNGDSCTDVVSYGIVLIAACNGADSTQFVSGQFEPVGAIDWDGDGKDDLLQRNGSTVQVRRWLGSTFATATTTGLTVANGEHFIAGDSNGDGLADLIKENSSGALFFGLHNGALAPPDLATSFTDGWGIAAYPVYKAITQDAYTKGSGAPAGDMDFQGAMYVVKEVSQSDGRGNSYLNEFWYTGARFNRQGRGFLGFATTRTRDKRNDLYRFVNYRQDYPYVGLVSSEELRRPDGSTKIRQTVNTYGVHVLAGANCQSGRCFPYLSGSTSTTYELTAGAPSVQVETVSNTFDTYGNLTQSSATVTDSDAASPFNGQSWTSVVNHTITNDTGTNWCLGKPTVSTTQNSAPGQPTLTRTVAHAVDYPKCRYTSETLEPTSSSLTVVTTLDYDSCGNLNFTSIVGHSPGGAALPARTTTTNYGTRCQFPESVTNALSQTATVGYDYAKGVKSSSTDPNGVSTSWLYDSFGRMTHEYRPDGTITHRTYADCASGPCWGVNDLRFAVTEYHYDSAAALIRRREMFHDGLERLRYDEGHQVLGTWVNVVHEYDALGRKTVEYNPYSSASNGYQVTSYDLIDRPTAIALYNASGTLDRQTTAAYAGQKVTLTDAKNNVTVKWNDVTGKLRRIVDPSPGGTTNYTYNSLGYLVQSVDAIGATTTHAYNLHGFKTATNDPDAGNWTFAVNSLGEVLTQTDAKNQTTIFTFDLLGRMVTRRDHGVGSDTIWTYGTSAANKNIGRVQSVSTPDGNLESYTFDSLGRPQQATYSLDGTAYQVNYAYNTQGTLDKLTYPTSTSGYRFALKYEYSYGFLRQVKDNATGSSFWTLNSANDSGAPLTEVLGNGALVTSGYKSWTNELTSRKVGTGGSTNNLEDLAYQWDVNGNLARRESVTQGLTEIMFMDGLNRLTGSTLNGNFNLIMNYDASGNVTHKHDAGSMIGNFDYTTPQAGCDYYTTHAQPHAVRKAGSWVYCYDANGNVTKRNGGAITWAPFNLPTDIAYAGNSTQFFYNASRQRWKQMAQYGAVTETTRYIGGIMEKVERGSAPTEYRHYIPGGSNGAVYTRRSDGTNSTYYMTSDHLGSGDLILDSSANILARESFTAFGARRGSNWQGNPTTGDYTAFQNTTRRGFTGHEMLDSVSLVHMNGRVYDPYVGRFLTPDPIIQTIGESQALNPFSYVMNNPLALTDPSGYSWLSKLFKKIGGFFKKFWRPILAIVVAVVSYGYLSGLAASWIAPAACVAPGSAASIGIGALSGAMTGALAGGIAGGWKGALAGFVTGGILGGANAYYGNAWSIDRLLIEGAAGGMGSEIQGGKFADGFKIAAGFFMLRWSAYEMRKAVVRQVCGGTRIQNCTTQSVGAFDDHIKLTGKTTTWPKLDWKGESTWPFGAQGQSGELLGVPYPSGSIRDYVLEGFAGSHDWMGSFRAGVDGALIPYTRLGNALWFSYQVATIPVAAPFAFATLVPTGVLVPSVTGVRR